MSKRKSKVQWAACRTLGIDYGDYVHAESSVILYDVYAVHCCCALMPLTEMSFGRVSMDTKSGVSIRFRAR